MSERVARIRTSDRTQFKGCRRKWGWQSALKGNRDRAEPAQPLWLGSGFHYAMEDYYGYNFYGKPSTAFKAFVEANKRTPGQALPDALDEVVELGVAMLDYYTDYWLQNRDGLQTLWIDGVPQVELNIEIELPPEIIPEGAPYDRVVYDATIDRVVVDERGWIWPLDYKTAKQFETGHLETDPQINSYTWALWCTFPQYTIGGFIYQQHKKEVPQPPRVLNSGKISTAQYQNTTFKLYERELIKLYGSVANAPYENTQKLAELGAQESELHDRAIRRDFTERNQHQLEAEGEKILLEVAEMLDPNLPLYPNPTRSCGSMCPFFGACVAFDDGGDFEQILEMDTVKKQERAESWRKHLPDLEELQ